MNTGERRLCEWQFGLSGSFFRSLFNAISVADRENLTKLERAFPDEVKAYKRFAYEVGYWERLSEEYRAGRF
ncbi:MAG: hypothetical protein N2V78_09455 [Methanophagales archaeon]|nr:hypothetical protein [Methanophagales archaeon]